MEREPEPTEREILALLTSVVSRAKARAEQFPLINHGTTIPDWAYAHFLKNRYKSMSRDVMQITSVLESTELSISYTVNDFPYTMFLRREWFDNG